MPSRSRSDGSGLNPEAFERECRSIMEGHWRHEGFTCPNARTYPWLWLWDSCFHAVVWARLGEPGRAVEELSTALGSIDVDGFVPHLRYLDGSDTHQEFWGRPGCSSITQPPMYGHAVAALVDQGVEVPQPLMAAAGDGLRFLLERRRRSSAGLVELVHPWESGCDHSPRWDDLVDPDGGAFDHSLWFRRKGELLLDVERDLSGSPVWNPSFAVGSVAFNALISFNASELARVSGDEELADLGAELDDLLDQRWEPGLRTWVDDGPTATGSGRTRTLEALLPLLVETDVEIIDSVVLELIDGDGFGAEFGLRQVHLAEPTFTRESYWRGPTWPQLDYLIWLALVRVGREEVADRVAVASRRGALASGFSEYWDPDSGSGGGAAPQSWATLAWCMGSWH